MCVSSFRCPWGLFEDSKGCFKIFVRQWAIDSKRVESLIILQEHGKGFGEQFQQKSEFLAEGGGSPGVSHHLKTSSFWQWPWGTNSLPGRCPSGEPVIAVAVICQMPIASQLRLVPYLELLCFFQNNAGSLENLLQTEKQTSVKVCVPQGTFEL